MLAIYTQFVFLPRHWRGTSENVCPYQRVCRAIANLNTYTRPRLDYVQCHVRSIFRPWHASVLSSLSTNNPVLHRESVLTIFLNNRYMWEICILLITSGPNQLRHGLAMLVLIICTCLSSRVCISWRENKAQLFFLWPLPDSVSPFLATF